MKKVNLFNWLSFSQAAKIEQNYPNIYVGMDDSQPFVSFELKEEFAVELLEDFRKIDVGLITDNTEFGDKYYEKYKDVLHVMD